MKPYSPQTKQTWVPMCPECHCGHILVGVKTSEFCPVTLMCYECRRVMALQEVQWKRL